jgi:uncharacterized protein YprB with RNaseH-like and TPR domain
MLDTESQLARLKERIAAIDRRFANKKFVSPSVHNGCSIHDGPSRWFIEEWSEGQVVTNESGAHFQSERLFAAHKRHGSAEIGALAELPETLLDALSENEIASVPPERWAFLDTETTGLAGGTGTYAFLIGLGRITKEGFRVRQYFMREFAEEASVLAALEAELNRFDVLITYNGKTYDQPLLETRYRMSRRKPPFGRLRHLDLLHGARRIWKLRLESCRLMHLEQQILGVYRDGDLPGEMIPYVYFEYLRSREAQRLVPIFHHNAMDILTLACLSAIVPAVFRRTDPSSLLEAGVRRGEDLLGIARWLLNVDGVEQGLDLLKRAVDAGLPDFLLFRTLWDIASLEKKLGRVHEAFPLFIELSACRNPFRAAAFEEIAKHYERNEKNAALALEFTNQALSFGECDSLLRRRARLEKRLAKPQSRRLL